MLSRLEDQPLILNRAFDPYLMKENYSIQFKEFIKLNFKEISHSKHG